VDDQHILKKCKLAFCLTLVFSNSFLLIACQARNTIKGEINNEFVSQLEEVEDGSIITVTSTGGDPDTSEIAAEIIQSKQLSILVQSACISSCVEYLLPAATNIQFKGNPIVGVHQNPQMIDGFKDKKVNYRTNALCHFEDNLKKYQILQNGKRNDFSLDVAIKETVSRLNLEEVKYNQKEDCVEVGFRFQNDLWLPNSQQLNLIFGLNFTGSVCADNVQLCSKYLNKKAPSNLRFVVGDKLFVNE